VDATNWEIGPCKFGRWQSYGKMSVRGSKQNLRAEVEWYLALEQRARQRWKKEMAKLAVTESPVVRLVANGNINNRPGRFDEPTVRLAADPASGGGGTPALRHR
jgi:hypothetical protein